MRHRGVWRRRCDIAAALVVSFRYSVVVAIFVADGVAKYLSFGCTKRRSLGVALGKPVSSPERRALVFSLSEALVGPNRVASFVALFFVESLDSAFDFALPEPFGNLYFRLRR